MVGFGGVLGGRNLRTGESRTVQEQVTNSEQRVDDLGPVNPNAYLGNYLGTLWERQAEQTFNSVTPDAPAGLSWGTTAKAVLALLATLVVLYLVRPLLTIGASATEAATS